MKPFRRVSLSHTLSFYFPRRAQGETCTLAFSQLDHCADIEGGSLNTNWDAAKGVHAIDDAPF